MEFFSKAFGAIASLIAIFFVMQTVTETWTESVVSDYEYKVAIKDKLALSEKEIDDLRSRLENIKKMSVDVSSGNPAYMLAAKVDGIAETNSNLMGRIETIESAAAIDPAKLISLALIQKDLESLDERFSEFKEDQKGELSSISSRVDSIIYGILTVALAVLSISLPALVSFFKKSKSNN
ncbi:hypothetical protein [Simiduia aestuariiviva]|uniref:Putative LPLAT superfamily acyltransferase n=1 Tax=Simiduia aestuariiviva TaxID=1510459 RepID=A0A839UN81_9GAMM|nr:hypothetical protein [Simiduia aestuariiviva]MBB3166825.1 putative LPLAT superfamily acyltransferase [Simiduia aestuariiviva]